MTNFTKILNKIYEDKSLTGTLITLKKDSNFYESYLELFIEHALTVFEGIEDKPIKDVIHILCDDFWHDEQAIFYMFVKVERIPYLYHLLTNLSNGVCLNTSNKWNEELAILLSHSQESIKDDEMLDVHSDFIKMMCDGLTKICLAHKLKTEDRATIKYELEEIV